MRLGWGVSTHPNRQGFSLLPTPFLLRGLLTSTGDRSGRHGDPTAHPRALTPLPAASHQMKRRWAQARRPATLLPGSVGVTHHYVSTVAAGLSHNTSTGGLFLQWVRI